MLFLLGLRVCCPAPCQPHSRLRLLGTGSWLLLVVVASRGRHAARSLASSGALGSAVLEGSVSAIGGSGRTLVVLGRAAPPPLLLLSSRGALSGLGSGKSLTKSRKGTGLAGDEMHDGVTSKSLSTQHYVTFFVISNPQTDEL